MRLYLRVEDQTGKILELVCDGESQPIPDVGDRIETNYMKAQVVERFFYYDKPDELALLLKVREYDVEEERR